MPGLLRAFCTSFLSPQREMAQTSVYVYDGTELPVSDAMKEDFHRDGFIIVRNLLCQKELAILEVRPSVVEVVWNKQNQTQCNIES